MMTNIKAGHKLNTDLMQVAAKGKFQLSLNNAKVNNKSCPHLHLLFLDLEDHNSANHCIACAQTQLLVQPESEGVKCERMTSLHHELYCSVERLVIMNLCTCKQIRKEKSNVVILTGCQSNPPHFSFILFSITRVREQAWVGHSRLSCLCLQALGKVLANVTWPNMFRFLFINTAHMYSEFMLKDNFLRLEESFFFTHRQLVCFSMCDFFSFFFAFYLRDVGVKSQSA